MRADEELETALDEIWQRGHAVWPELQVEPTTLAAWLGERAPTDAPPVAWIHRLCASDVFLACACAQGIPAALATFDATFIDKMNIYLRALHPTPEIVAETQQRLREKLFVGVSGEPPKIRKYEGRGALEGWVRIAAVRTALNLIDAEKAAKPRPDDAEEIARAIVPNSDPELELIRARCRSDFIDAFRKAIAALSQRDRALLRAAFVEQLTPARIGAMYGVHRTTAMRWLEGAQEEILNHTRTILIERHQLTPSECNRLFSLVKTGIDASLASLLASAP